MGKIKKNKAEVAKNRRATPFDEQVYADSFVTPSDRLPRLKEKKDEVDDEYVDGKLSQKILSQARKQQEELEEEFGTSSKLQTKTLATPRLTTFSSKKEESSDDESECSELNDGDNFYENIEINEEDEKALQMFMVDEPQVRRTLADIIMEKFTEKKTEIHTQLSDGGSCVNMMELDPRIIEMYKGVKKVLSHYRSGKLPKAFKVIPSLANWEQVLYLTEPDCWTAAAVYQATRIFASNLKEKMAQRFFNLVLLPRIRDDITEFKKLNFHLYQALKKALFKPGAFFKGIILPLCSSRSCSLREAVIIGSVIAGNSIPVLHSSAAILKIAEMDYSGANSIFLRILLDKKYALPYRVIDAVVYHFLSFKTDKRELHVLWHQALLTFVQRYKEDLSSEQKEALLELLRIHIHHQITVEVRRELQQSKCRDVEMMQSTTILNEQV